MLVVSLLPAFPHLVECHRPGEREKILSLVTVLKRNTWRTVRLCSESWLRVGMGEHMMGGVGEKEGKLRFSGFQKGETQPCDREVVLGLTTSCLPSIHEVWVINLYVLDWSGFCSWLPFVGKNDHNFSYFLQRSLSIPPLQSSSSSW